MDSPGILGPKNLYYTIFQRMGVGCAHGRVVYRDGEAEDLLFLEVNCAFETATGLARVQGRRASELIPGFQETSPGLLATFGRVAGADVPESFETYVRSLGAWFSMHVFCPAAGEFVVTLENITARKAEDQERRGPVEWPDHRPTALPAPDAQEPSAGAPGGVGTVPGKVLLVDDDEDVTFLMSRKLRKAGVPQVEVARSGEAALALLDAGARPDVIVMDQNMPRMSGLQTLARIRERRLDIPVLLSSGQLDLDEGTDLGRLRAAAIPKPFTLEEIRAKLAEFEAGGALPSTPGEAR